MKNVHQQIDDVEKGQKSLADVLRSVGEGLEKLERITATLERITAKLAKFAKYVARFTQDLKQYGWGQVICRFFLSQDPTPAVC